MFSCHRHQVALMVTPISKASVGTSADAARMSAYATMISTLYWVSPIPLIQPDTADQVRKARVGADRIEVGMHFEELHDIRLLLAGLLEPNEGLVVFAQPQISIHKSARGNVTRLFAFLQLREEAKSVAATAGVGIRPDEHAGGGRAAVGNRDRFLQNRDCIAGLIVGHQRESKVQKHGRVVRVHS